MRQGASHRDEVLASAPQLACAVQHHWQVQQNFLSSASREKGNPWFAKVDSKFGRAWLPRRLRERQIRERMSYVLGCNTAFAVVVPFERKDHQHAIDELLHSPDAALLPRPQLR